ncbi:DNA polymerase [Candidatus Wolfebacteria bacterium]|nr:DNA polymerase [Candidatus Wolfebacteria bacterium]
MPKKAQHKKRLVLLDAHAIIHRAYHALPDFTSGEGEPTGALYGLVAMLLKAVSDLKPDYLVACYDLPEPTERHKVFDEYKAGREKADEALVHQIERSRDIFRAFSIPIYEKAGFEADDIIGTVVESVKGRKTLETFIVSGDMDTLQLVRGTDVRVYTLKKGIKDTIIYDKKAVEDRFGFSPELLPDYKGLRGDPSDNIPGVPGVGEKTATELIRAFGSIETLYTALAKDAAAFEKKGVTKRTLKLLKEHRKDAEFSKMLAEIRRDAPIAFRLPESLWENSFDITNVLKLFRELSFRTLAERVKQMFGDGKTNLEEGESAARDEAPGDSEVREVGIALWVLDSEHTNPSIDDILRFANTNSFEKAKVYILKELKKQGLEKVYRDIELPLVPVIERVERRGVKVDTGYLKKLSKDYHARLAKLEQGIYRHVGKEFNINSPQQLAAVLFDEMGLTAKAKTAGGQRSTRESELQKLAGAHPVIDDILAYRELQKLLSTYIDNLPHLVSPRDGRLHTTFLQHGTTTGRMSSQNPNLQNIPVRSDLGQPVRNAFVAEKGFTLVDLDYSQIELRVSAALSGDEKMIEVFREGGDIHRAVAEEVFGSADADARRKAKIINFGIHYGMGANALAKTIGTTRKEAQHFLDEYFKRFSQLGEHIEKAKREVAKKGYTETLFGRRRYFPGITSHLSYVRAEAERMAINAPIQGTNADIMKIAMRRADEWIRKEKCESDVFLVLQIHDELVYEVKDELVEKVAPQIKSIMENVLVSDRLAGISLVVDVSVGKNWGEMKKLF